VGKDKRYDHITGAGFSKLDELLSFMHGVGMYDLIEDIKSPLKRTPDIPRSFIHLALALRPVLEITGINQVPQKLFSSPAILKKMGLSLEVIEGGFSPRNKRGKNLPICLDTIYDEAKRVEPDQWQRLLSGQIILLADKKFIKKHPGIYVIDSTDIEVNEGTQYENISKTAREVTEIDKNGRMYTKIEVIYGYKLDNYATVGRRGAKIHSGCSTFVPINVHEDRLAYPLIKTAYGIQVYWDPDISKLYWPTGASLMEIYLRN
jgi:hypothetical protein